jgi:D-sedoheptulose 7-phosphate isomerase
MKIVLDSNAQAVGSASAGAAGSRTAGRLEAIAADYLRKLGSLLEELDINALERALERVRSTREAGGIVYVAGNGGSAATASHWANDLGKAAKKSGCRPIRVIGLSDNISWFSALANDEGYESVFTGQLDNFAEPGDLLVVISASGNSPNLVRAIELARERSVATVGLLGFDGGLLKSMVDECIWCQCEIGEYGLVETAHSVVLDILTTCLIFETPPDVSSIEPEAR